MDNQNNFLNFIAKYKGAIIGGVVAIILISTALYKLLIAFLVILACIYIGNYIQKNKDTVKETLKSFIDRF